MVESSSSTYTPWRDVVDAGMFADEPDDHLVLRRRSADDSGRRRSADGAPSSEMPAPPPPPPLNGRADARDDGIRDYGVTFSTPSNLWGAVAAGDREGTGGGGSSSAFVATLRQAEPTGTTTETTTTTATSDSEMIGAGEGVAASALGSKWWASDSEASEGEEEEEEEEEGEVGDEEEDEEQQQQQQQQFKQKQADHNLRRDLVLGRLLGLVCAPAGGALPHALPSLAAQLQRLDIIPLWLKVRTEGKAAEICVAHHQIAGLEVGGPLPRARCRRAEPPARSCALPTMISTTIAVASARTQDVLVDRPAMLNRAFGKVFQSVLNDKRDLRGVDPRTRWALHRFWERLNYAGEVGDDAAAAGSLGSGAKGHDLPAPLPASRYRSDFEEHNSLGAGAFGQVVRPLCQVVVPKREASCAQVETGGRVGDAFGVL